MSELMDFLTEEDDESFASIANDDQANRQILKIAKLNKELERIEAQADNMIERVKKWKESEGQKIKEKREWYQHLLTGYLIALQENGEAGKTYKLPAGEIKSRAGRVKTEVTDEAAFIAWARENAPEAIKEKALTSQLPPYKIEGDVLVTPEGEVVPGIQLTQPTGDSYSVVAYSESETEK